MKHILFVGLYPNAVEKYLNVFFQNLIFGIRDCGYNCSVISPVSITRYRKEITKIPKHEIHYTDAGNDIDVYYPRTFSFSSKVIKGFHMYRLTESLFRLSCRRCSRKVKKVDAVYGHFLLRGGLAAINIACMRKVPGFFAYGECSYETEIGVPYGQVDPTDFSGLTGVVAVSSKNRRELFEILSIPPLKILLAPNAVDTNSFCVKDRSQSEAALGVAHSDKFTVGFVGGFIERKGDKRVLEAVNLLNGVDVMFAGRGNNPPQGDKVKFCGALPHVMLPFFYNAIDVFVLPTLAEGCSNAIIEALACGKPVVSSNLDFNWDVLNGGNSLLIDPNNISEIASAIQKLKDDRSLYTRLAEGARRTAETLRIRERSKRIVEFMEEAAVRKWK